MNTFQKRVAVALIAAGVSLPSAYVAVELTIPSEGVENRVYLDPVGLPTVCVGHMDKSMKVGTYYTDQQCADLFVVDWLKHEKQLQSVVKVPYKSEWMKAALTDFTFNLGIGNVASSTLLKDLNAKRYDSACNRLLDWVYAGKKVLKGLVIRRDRTKAYCMGTLPKDAQISYEDWKKELGYAEKEGSK